MGAWGYGEGSHLCRTKTMERPSKNGHFTHKISHLLPPSIFLFLMEPLLILLMALEADLLVDAVVHMVGTYGHSSMLFWSPRDFFFFSSFSVCVQPQFLSYLILLFASMIFYVCSQCVSQLYIVRVCACYDCIPRCNIISK